MKKILQITTAIVIVALITGCGLSRGEIKETAKISIQETLNEDPRLKEYDLKVDDIELFKKGANSYKGYVSILHNGSAHDITVEILVDGDQVMWEAPPGSFMFIAQEELQNLFQTNTGLKNESDSTDTYEYEIVYPNSDVHPIIAEEMKKTSKEIKSSFFESISDNNEYFSFPSFSITYKKALESKLFIEYLIDIYTFTGGGAHGISESRTIVFDKKRNKIITLSDLFNSTIALDQISQFTKRKLASSLYSTASLSALKDFNKRLITEGAAPKYKNYSSFLILSSEYGTKNGIVFTFQPYQVAPYNAGMPKVFVPSHVFSEFLVPQYQIF